MRADVVFIGGGLAALMSGIKLLKAGKSVIIVCAGQSALHFSSGSLCLLNRINGRRIFSPLEELKNLPVNHPYNKIERSGGLAPLLDEAKEIFNESGIELIGNKERNHYHLTPFGVFTPAWLTSTDHLVIDDPCNPDFKKAAIIGIDGFLDFYPKFIERGLSKNGIKCTVASVNIEEFDRLRQNPTEMRAPNIARVLTDEAVERYADAINENINGADIAIIPAVVGLNDSQTFQTLREKVKCRLHTVSTIPVSVTGIRMKILLQEYFTRLGGWYLMGDSVTDGSFENGKLRFINTANLGNTQVRASHYVMASGGLFSRGLKSDHFRIFEPIFGLDVKYNTERADWYDRNFFHSQEFMKFGVVTDDLFHCRLQNSTIENLYAIGSILGGDYDPLSEGVGAGVTVSSALFVARQLLNNNL